mgnify:CR=1 FL=1|jgi:hypothetical protein
MKMYLKITSLICAILFSFSFSSSAQARKKANKDTENFRYEIEAVNTGVQGTYLIKVWSYSKKPAIAIEQSKKNAVHGIIFKGFAGKPGVPGQKPLASDPSLEDSKEDFFTPFFADGGDYLKYVNIAGDGSIAPEDRMKVGKEYKIGVIVSVDVAKLRKALETAGIVKSLDSGF